MEKQDSIGNYSHGINLVERKNLIITGVKKIENFDTEQFLLETSMGFVIVKGEDLELIKLDTLLHVCEGFNITLIEFFSDPIFNDVEQD